MHRNLDPVFDLYKQEVAKTANYTVLPGDNGNLFTNAGASAAIVFTLPALGPLYKFGFIVIAGQNVSIASAAGDDIVTFNDAAADQISFETSNELIGGYVELFTNQAADKWYVRRFSNNTITVTS